MSIELAIVGLVSAFEEQGLQPPKAIMLGSYDDIFRLVGLSGITDGLVVNFNRVGGERAASLSIGGVIIAAVGR